MKIVQASLTSAVALFAATAATAQDMSFNRLCCANQVANGSPFTPDGFIPRL
jgi:hypothetical protein